MFLVLAFLLLLLAPDPWNIVGFIGCLVLFLGELWFWKGRVQHLPVRTGADTLVGRTATVVRALDPTGEIRIQDAAEVWAARCDGGAPEGSTVRVVGRDGLTLIVERTSPAEAPGA